MSPELKPELQLAQQLADAVESLRQNFARLDERLAALERAVGECENAPAPPGIAAPPADAVSEELLVTIGAAVAAFLGVKPRIRQIRLLGSASWAQQGRATIQASHAVTLHRG